MLQSGTQNPEKRSSSTKKNIGKSCSPVWIPFIDRVDGVTPIFFHTNSPRYKDPIKEAKGLSWNSSRFLLDKTIFRKQEDDGTPRSKPRKVNIIILINGLSDDINALIRHFQDHIKVFHPKEKSRNPSSKLSRSHRKWVSFCTAPTFYTYITSSKM